MSRLLRGFFIVWIVLRYGLDELLLSSLQRPGLRHLIRIVSIGRDLSAPRGERLRMAVPHGHWKTTTLIAGMRSSGVVAPLVIDRPVNRVIFEAWVEQALVLELRPADIVVMDNLSSHKGPAVRALIEAAGARLLYLPPYSPDFNPIENLFAKIKALLRKEAARTIDTLWAAIGRIIDIVTPTECQNMFAAAGYDPDR